MMAVTAVEVAGDSSLGEETATEARHTASGDLICCPTRGRWMLWLQNRPFFPHEDAPKKTGMPTHLSISRGEERAGNDWGALTLEKTLQAIISMQWYGNVRERRENVWV